MDPVDQAIEVLNRLHEKDPTVLQTLIYLRVQCNAAVAHDETIQVGKINEFRYEVGLLGIINGLFGVDEEGWGYIQANIDQPTGTIHNFSRRK